MHKIKVVLILVIFFFGLKVQSQEIPIGAWKDHLSYQNAIAVTSGGGKVYCASESAVFSYNINDGELDRLSSVSGLSDIGISDVKYNNATGKLLIAYTNGNLDIINSDNEIINLSFIKTSGVVGDKGVNQIVMRGSNAYLATGFGIVVVNLNKNEVFDTYLFGSNGTNVFTNAVTFDNQSIYAATDEGVFYADLNSANLADYNEWNKILELGIYNYSEIVSFQNLIFVGKESSGWATDTLLYNLNGIWNKFIPNGINLFHLSSQNNKLVVGGHGYARIFDDQMNEEQLFYTFQNQFGIVVNDVYLNGGETWVADANSGLLHYFDNWNGEVIYPNGPTTSDCYKIDIANDQVWVASGTPSNFNIRNRYNYYSEGQWQSVEKIIVDDETGNQVYDLVSVVINPSIAGKTYMGSWGRGMVEFNNGTASKVYRAQNSELDSVNYGVTVIASMDYDDQNNLWISSSYSSDVLSVITPGGEWYKFSFKGVTNELSYYPHMVVDSEGVAWLIDKKYNEVIAYKTNNTFGDSLDDVVAQSANILTGNFEVNTFEQDLNGEMWFGTNQGIAVLQSPSSVFSSPQSLEPIFIQQDGQTQLLLETETVNALAIDGANQKWIATQGSGVYLMSEDGTEEVLHFTAENSPLFSNNVLDVAINHKNGEVFFATEKGLISYKGMATESNDEFNNVLVYPNPVKNDYNGVIAIKGLTKDTDVRITDISGNLVFQTKSLGGQAIWNGQDLNGRRVQTGVYMVFSAGPLGELKNAAKILFIN